MNPPQPGRQHQDADGGCYLPCRLQLRGNSVHTQARTLCRWQERIARVFRAYLYVLTVLAVHLLRMCWENEVPLLVNMMIKLPFPDTTYAQIFTPDKKITITPIVPPTDRYANRAKNIKNKPKINEDPKDTMLRQYKVCTVTAGPLPGAYIPEVCRYHCSARLTPHSRWCRRRLIILLFLYMEA